MIEEAYISFETAKLLKEKGFNEPCLYYYFSNGKIGKRKGLKDRNCPAVNTFSMPTQQMAMRWLREQNKIISIVHSCVTNKYKIIITQFNKLDIAYLGNTLYSSDDYNYFSYEEAAEVAIKYCLENLI